MVVYRNSGTIWSNQASPHQCGINKLPSIDKKRAIAKRTEQGCPMAKKINYMGVAADCTYVHICPVRRNIQCRSWFDQHDHHGPSLSQQGIDRLESSL
ncbi:hypothetical protein G6F68_018416 [Rhizopus microsporus]|nr:hypothetical protein G6F68_018416 [Rhizopus microsporus]